MSYAGWWELTKLVVTSPQHKTNHITSGPVPPHHHHQTERLCPVFAPETSSEALLAIYLNSSLYRYVSELCCPEFFPSKILFFFFFSDFPVAHFSIFYACFFHFLSWCLQALQTCPCITYSTEYLWLEWIRGRDILEAAKENKVGAIRHFIRSDVNPVQKTDEEGTSLKDVAWSLWNSGDAMTWYNGTQWPGVVSFHLVVPCFDVNVEFLWFLS